LSKRNSTDFIDLVEKAKRGDRNSYESLAGLCEKRLRSFVYRLTRDEDLTTDIVGETLLEMVKVFEQLNNSEKFWAWVYSIATNKLRLHWRKQKAHTKYIHRYQVRKNLIEEPLEQMISNEIRDVTRLAMQRLSLQDRAVIAMRCYDQMEYDQIAESMGCSIFSARMRFYRAKKSLARELGKFGFAKGTLLTALIIFGKMTSTSEAAASQLAVSPALLNAGTVAPIVSSLRSKTAIISISAAAVITAGTFIGMYEISDKKPISAGDTESNTGYAEPAHQHDHPCKECWFFYPEGLGGPVMTRHITEDHKVGYCSYVADAQANYHYDADRRIVYIENTRKFNKDLCVRRLPGDSKQIRSFLDQTERNRISMPLATIDNDGMLIIVKNQKETIDQYETIIHHNVLDEEYFRYGWPVGTIFQDNRDVMHKRGWTYFDIEGHIRGQKVTGCGRIPFVYSQVQANRAWLKLRIGKEITVYDNMDESGVRKDGESAMIFAGGSFFGGLARPWMGLHCIDTVRRDAAEEAVRFESDLSEDCMEAKVTLFGEGIKMLYSIDLENDFIERIDFVNINNGNQLGRVSFSYLQDIEDFASRYTQPNINLSGKTNANEPGVFWLWDISKP